MKKVVSIILSLMIVMGICSISAHAVESSKISEDLQKVIDQSNPEDKLKVTVWFAYPECPEPDFTEEDYGDTLDDMHRYMHDYRAYKKAYYTEQNQKAIDEVTGSMDVEVNWVSDLVATANITLKVKDIPALAELSIIGVLFANYDDVAPVEPADETSVAKIKDDLQTIIDQSNPEEKLKVTVWFAYPECPEPDFTEEDYGETLDDMHRYMHDYRAYKKAYYTEQNQKAIDEVYGTIDVEVIWVSNLVATADITLKVKDIPALAELSIIGAILANYDDVAPVEPSEDTPHLYEDIYRAMVPGNGIGAYYVENSYDELYYHYDDNNEIDWALVEGISCMQNPMTTSMVVADRVVNFSVEAESFKFGYGIYDVAMGKFVDLYDIKDDLGIYTGLSDVLWDLKIGKPVGDADNDGELTILDATLIQRYKAELISDEEIREVYWLCDENDREMKYADADQDGEVTILDATRIQRTLAGLD